MALSDKGYFCNRELSEDVVKKIRARNAKIREKMKYNMVHSVETHPITGQDYDVYMYGNEKLVQMIDCAEDRLFFDKILSDLYTKETLNKCNVFYEHDIKYKFLFKGLDHVTGVGSYGIRGFVEEIPEISVRTMQKYQDIGIGRCFLNMLCSLLKYDKFYGKLVNSKRGESIISRERFFSIFWNSEKVEESDGYKLYIFSL